MKWLLYSATVAMIASVSEFVAGLPLIAFVSAIAAGLFLFAAFRLRGDANRQV